ncbi:CelD/BcsL family acetyltransferase involved in cellulose biosynthesis [Lysinibacillus parviboronicapiens]|uniref:CelD/BcsL family acetyltransferase involved in cellulose biosynthesis n=1 Tax=Lysinibacillus parviboronicapiens TaxID=436516 RepID=A0ABV2PKF5_9BACI
MLVYRLVTRIDELESYKDTWSGILEREKNDNPFIEYEWVSTWWRTLGSKENVEIYIVERNGECLAFFPFIRFARFGGIHQFSFLGQGFATYMEVIAESIWKEQVMEYLLKELTQKYQRVIFVLHGLLESKQTSYLLEKYAQERQLPHSVFRTVTPYIDFKSVELNAFLQKHHKNFKSINRREKRLKALGHLKFQEVSAKNLDGMFELFKRRWRKKIDRSGFTEQQTRLFFERLAMQQSNAFCVEVDNLEFEDHWIGFTIDLCCRNRNFCQAMGHEPDFNIFGPGRLIEKANMLKAHSSNYRFYDFGSGYEPYKFEWYTHLDFTRIFVMSSEGTRERLLRLMMVVRDTLKRKLSGYHQLVKLKRDRLGEFQYFLKEARLKDWFIALKKGINRMIAVTSFDLYYLQSTECQTSIDLPEIAIQDVMESDNRSQLIPQYYRGYKLYGENAQQILYLRHDTFIREEALGFTQLLPPNSTYIKEHAIELFPKIVAQVQQEGRAVCTTVNWYEWRKRKMLVKLGFEKVERVRISRLFKWQRISRQDNKWAKHIHYKGQKLDHIWHLVLFPLLI